MNERVCFVLSTLLELWPSSGSSIFIADPYVDHWISNKKIKEKYRIDCVAPYRRKTREDLINDSKVVDDKYRKYVDILVERLNKIHNRQYPREFWKKVLSLAFIRHITLFHELFMKCELFFDGDRHYSHILSESSFYTPIDYEDHRNRFQYSNLGQEQLLSIYLRLFYVDNVQYYERNLDTKSIEIDIYSRFLHVARYLKSFIGRLSKSLLTLLFHSTKHSNDKIAVGLLGVLFNKRDYVSLTKNRRIVAIDNYNVKVDRDYIDVNAREYLSHAENDFDRFDLFFFEAMKCCMPRHLVEDFVLHEKKCLDVIDQNRSIRYVISETWISDSHVSLMLALMQERGIHHLHNEHNCFFHPCEGKYFEYVYDMSDSVLTLGWKDQELPKLTRAASLFSI